MIIGIDCRTILHPGVGEQAGVGHYTYHLVKNLLEIDQVNQYVLFFDSRFKPGSEFDRPNVRISFFPFYQYKKYLPIAYSHLLATAVINRENLDIYHSPANTIPLSYNRPAVVTVHDLAIYRYPELFPGPVFGRQSLATKVVVPRSLIKAKKIIAVSKSTKSDIVEEFGIPKEKIKVIYESAPQPEQISGEQIANVRKRYGLGDKYFLFVGTVEPRKNLNVLISAFRNAKLLYDSPLRDFQLVIAGARGWKDETIATAIADANASLGSGSIKRQGFDRRSGIDNRPSEVKQQQGERRSSDDRRVSQAIKHIGYVSGHDKHVLMAGAHAFVFPSLYEGFGLPVVEAMSYGVPVIAADNSSLPEVVGDGGILIDAAKESELADALQQLVTDDGLREELSIKAKAMAKTFDWRQCAQETLAVYQEAVKKG